MQILPFLWFDAKAEEAANYYVSLFKNSRIDNVSRYGDGGPMPAGTAMVVEFTLNGQEFMALNGGESADAPQSPTKGAIALFVSCETQDEVDDLWTKLQDGGGRSMQCGWVQDKYGFAWNIVPQGLGDLLGSDDRERANRAMQAMMQMDKLDINELRRAYDGEPV